MPSLDFLEGQSPWLILGVIAILGLAYVLRGAVKRSGDTGEGKQGIEAANAAADYLTVRAVEDRDAKVQALADKAAIEAEMIRLTNRLGACEDLVTEMGGRHGDVRRRAAERAGDEA